MDPDFPSAQAQVDLFSSIAQIAQFPRPTASRLSTISQLERNQLKIGQRSSLFRVADNPDGGVKLLGANRWKA